MGDSIKNIVFSLIWAMLCSWITMKLIVLCDAEWHFTQMAFVPQIIGFIHGFGISAKTVLFLTLTALFTFTGIHRLFGGALKYLLGLVYILFWVTVIGAIIYYIAIFLIAHL
jgi:hypothetical protein